MLFSEAAIRLQAGTVPKEPFPAFATEAVVFLSKTYRHTTPVMEVELLLIGE
ncbi:hypothetical protein [Pontibacter brevis]